MKVIADEIFGVNNFRNEVIWRNTNSHNKATTYGVIHQDILVYSNSKDVKFHKQRRPPFKEYIAQNFKPGSDGTLESKTDLTAEGLRRGESGKFWHGYDPSARGRHWAIPAFVYELLDEDIDHLPFMEKLDYLVKHGFVYFPNKEGGQPRIRRPVEGVAGNFIMDIWAYQPYTHGIYEKTAEGIDEDVSWAVSKFERTGYPTQKPEGLLARIVEGSSDAGDVVLDAFAGGGTTCAVSEKLGRRWIGIDCGKLAIYTMQKRMLNLRKEIGNKGPKLLPKPFTLCNAGLYDFSKLRELPWDSWRFFALQLFQCRDEEHRIGGVGLDGYLKGASVLVFNHQKNPGARFTEETLHELHEALGSRVGSKMFIIAPALTFDFQQDWIDLDGVRYYALRIPYSIINELHNREFTALRQPSDEMAVNDTVEAVGFDFVRTPELKYECGRRKRKGDLFELGFIRLKTFKSEAVVREPLRTKANLETLSMVMLDYDYNDEVFDLDEVFYAEGLAKENWEILFPLESLGQQLMAVFIDIYGNEARVAIEAPRIRYSGATKEVTKGGGGEMTTRGDRQTFRNEDLVLKVTTNIDPTVWDETKYESFLDELCSMREYQKEAIRTTLRYLLGGKYADLRELARENFDQNDEIQQRYGSWTGMERHLQLPDQLSCSIDLATATGKSWVLYGLALILLAEGAVDRVLVLCPSNTIEYGLMEKFRTFAGDANLRALLPPDSELLTPRIINASETIVDGSICVENYHAILEHVKSSIRDSLKGQGHRVAVLNDEAHHVANEKGTNAKKWKGFLLDPEYGFRLVVGVSGTCYVGDEYFADVVSRYPLLQAIEERYVKDVEYVDEMPPEAENPEEKWQLIYKRHEDWKRRLRRRGIRPLTIVVTRDIKGCEQAAEELIDFLQDWEKISAEDAARKVLTVTSSSKHQPNIARLRTVDSPASKVEWIVSVSMLSEGWDVKNVFQIVPHEERAFNSKLLIAQVLGRGLRRPEGWTGQDPVVTVFNHDSWSGRIKHLVNEVLEKERRLSSCIIKDSPYNFDLHTLDYNRDEDVSEYQKKGDMIFVVETKGDEEISEPSPENQKKYEYAHDHFQRLNKWLENEGLATRYQFNFVSPKDYNQFFQRLRDNTLNDFRSELDVVMRKTNGQ